MSTVVEIAYQGQCINITIERDISTAINFICRIARLFVTLVLLV